MSEDCPHCVFEITEANCRGCFEGSHYKPKQITNADRIRTMSDDELAERLAILTDCVNCPCRDPHDQCDTVDKSCQKQWLDWLKKEVTT